MYLQTAVCGIILRSEVTWSANNVGVRNFRFFAVTSDVLGVMLNLTRSFFSDVVGVRVTAEETGAELTLCRFVWFVPQCPKCQVCIEKNGGCNHMQCSKCKHDFCWMCLGGRHSTRSHPQSTLLIGSVTITVKTSTDGATTLSCVNFSGYLGHVTICSWMLTIACCLVVGLGLDLVCAS